MKILIVAFRSRPAEEFAHINRLHPSDWKLVTRPEHMWGCDRGTRIVWIPGCEFLPAYSELREHEVSRGLRGLLDL